MPTLSWYAKRLSLMSVPEVGHRARRGLRIHFERLGLLKARVPVAADFLDIPPYAVGFKAVGKEPYVEAAEKLIAGHQSVFGLSQDGNGISPNWNRDPLTGTVAPLIFGKSVDYRDEHLVGNIKYLWEPNRHLELVTLAQAYALTGDERYLRCVWRWLDSWLEQCPYPLGVNWASALEVGIRLINWSLVWQLIGRSDCALFAGEQGYEFRRRWLESIYQHVHFIRHYYSWYSSANNHLIGEAAGVFVATCTWPYWTVFERWGNEAREILIDAAEAQTHADGVNREQAVAYQQFVVDFFILSALAGRSRGTAFPDAYWRTIEQMIEFIQAIMNVRGNVPMIGDADDGLVVSLSKEPNFCPYRSLLATGAMLFGRSDFAAKSGGLDDKTRSLLGESGWDDLWGKGTENRAGVRRQFPYGGYYVLGQELDTPNELRVIADAGPLGYLSIAAHGHADALSFVLSVAGREILIDPGTYTYQEPRWRSYFRGTGAHNTVRVDGEDQSVQGGNFMWLKHAQAKCLAFEYDDNSSRLLARHDGYTRLADAVVHERRIEQTGRSIEVADRLLCDGRHSIERCWHFSEHCCVSVERGVVIAENGPVRVTLRPVEALKDVRHLRASEEPMGGWVSRRFNVKSPSDSVFWINDIQGTSELKTLIEYEVRGDA